MKFILEVVVYFVILANCRASIAGGNLQSLDSAGEKLIFVLNNFCDIFKF